VPDGEQVTVYGTGYLPGSTIEITLGGNTTPPLCTVVADASGNIECEITVPGGTAPGDYEVMGAGTGADGLPANPTENLTVPPRFTPPPTSVPDGGGSQEPYLPALVALMALLSACLVACLRIQGSERPR